MSLEDIFTDTFSFLFEKEFLVEMLKTVDSLAFMNMNERILKYFKDKVITNKDKPISITNNCFVTFITV